MGKFGFYALLVTIDFIDVVRKKGGKWVLIGDEINRLVYYGLKSKKLGTP